MLDALDSVGWRGDGRVLQLNSFENRVLLVQLEAGGAVVVKFYRPGRWTDAQILEEHAFSAELLAAEVPVAAPLRGPQGQTLLRPDADAGSPWRFAVFDRMPGRGPELEHPGVLRRIGHFLGRLHATGAGGRFEHRLTLGLDAGREARDTVLATEHLDDSSRERWQHAAESVLQACAAVDAAVGEVEHLRLHGDCHLGNVLWTDAGPHFVDLDDAVNGPAMQDLWMLLAGDAATARHQRFEILEGYETFRELDPREWHRVEVLRSLRMLHYSAWLARRWHDPAFPAAFPWFGTAAYWSEQITRLQEQRELLEDALQAAQGVPRWD